MAKKTQDKSAKKEHKNSLVIENTTLQMTISHTDWNPVYKAVVKSAAKRLKVDGFRKGKVPPHIAQQHLRKDYLYQEVLDRVVPQHYEQLIKENKKSPITYPHFEPVAMPHDGDWVVSVHIAEQPVVSVKNYKKITKNAKKEAELTWKNEQKELNKKGKKDDKLTEKQQEAQKKDYILRNVFSSLIKELRPAIPQLLIQRETEREIESLSSSLDRVGMSLDQFLAGKKITRDQFTQETAASAVAKLQLTFILQEIIAEAKISVNESEISAFIAELNDPEAQNFYKEPEQKASVERIVLQNKLDQYLLNL